jgi:magnesium chelatase family protein
VLFLDELPEFRRDVVETLRTTMEEGHVVIARARARVEMPAGPLVVAAMNPCPCGFEGDEERLCRCGPDRVERYRGRVSGPLLDRFDLQVIVPRVHASDLRRERIGETSAAVRTRVERARAALREMGPASTLEALLAICERRAIVVLERAVDELGLSARGFAKALRVARTVAALDGRDRVGVSDVGEAVHMRALDRRWAVQGHVDDDCVRRTTQPDTTANDEPTTFNEEEPCP